jgi:hypothetical protein
MQSEENNLDNTFQVRVSSFPALYFSCTPLNQIIQDQKCMLAGNALSTFSKMYQTTQQWVLCPQAQEYTVVISTKFSDLHGWADCVNGFIRVVKQTNNMHSVPFGGIVGPAHLVRMNAASGSIDSVRLVNHHVDLDTYWTVYYVN